MRNDPKNPSPISGTRGQRGAVLVELVVAASIIAVVMAALGFYFVYHVGTMNSGRAQLKLQRIGSLLMEEMARDIREGKTTDLAVENTTYTQIEIFYPDITRHRCFSFDGVNEDIKETEDPNYGNLAPWELLDDSYRMGSEIRNHRIKCNLLGFKKEGDRVTIQFTLTHDLGNADTADDLTIDFGSAVKLRG